MIFEIDIRKEVKMLIEEKKMTTYIHNVFLMLKITFYVKYQKR